MQLKVIQTLGDTDYDITEDFIYDEDPMQYCHRCGTFNYAGDCGSDENGDAVCDSCGVDSSSMSYLQSQEDMDSLLKYLIKENDVELKFIEVENEEICNK